MTNYIESTDKLLINGPINAARLVGTIDGREKVIYLFFDFHISVLYQTQCPSYLSEDFVRYFVKTIKKTNKKKMFDFFFEIGPTFGDGPMPEYRGRYIDEVYRYFRSSINVVNSNNNDFKQTPKKITNKGSKYDTNLRLHYIDIRDYLKTDINIFCNEMHVHLDTLLCHQNVNMTALDRVVELLDMLQKEIHDTTSQLETFGLNAKSSRLTKSSIMVDAKINFINDVFKKLFSKYQNNNVKQKILYDSGIIASIQKILKSAYKHINNMKQVIMDFKEIYVPSNILVKGHYDEYTYGTDQETRIKFASNLTILFHEIDYEILVMYALIIDVYFMRRFLDKSYINNGVLYAGAMHCANCLHMLVKYFDFKITHVAYSAHDIDTLHKEIKKTNFTNDFVAHFMKPVFSQCVDLSDFPKNFD
jgi:hypothetical protein